MQSKSGLEPIVALFESSQFIEAKQLCQELCNHVLSDNTQAWCLLSAIHLKLGEFADAEVCSRKAIKLTKENTQACYYLGVALFRQGKHDDAIPPLRSALDANPRLMDAYIILSNIYNHQGLAADSSRVLGEAHEFAPDNVDITCLLAEACEKTNQTDDAMKLAKHAIKRSPLHPVANIVAARLDARSSNLSQALERLQRLLDKVKLGETNFSNAQYLLGKIYDRLGRFTEAYTAYELANKTASKLYGDRYRGGIMLDRIYRYRGAINKDSVKKWLQVDADDIEPVFLIGFPRSGTTLTEQILASHPGIVTSDERPFINDTYEKLLSSTSAGSGFPYSLGELSKGEIRRLRDYYYRSVRSSLGAESDYPVFIDKLPLNIVEVGLIKRLFSNPRFILVLRDPRDACLSSFMQAFIPNHAMANFLTLETAARFYAATMDLWLHYTGIFDLDFIELKYENLVADPRSETSRLLDFLGLEWDERVLEYHKRHQLTVSTPSYQDISSPVYTRSISRWQNYQDRFSEIQSILESFVNKFGY